VHHDGTQHAGGPFVAGWPIKIDGLAIDVLPLIGPGHNLAVGDLDPSPGLDVAAAPTTSNPAVFRPHGPLIRDVAPSPRGASPDVGDTLNLRELASGNGLYLTHAFDATGQEPAGGPKLTGGWVTGQPAAGDIDDDGLMEIAWATREGNYFVWDTPASICNSATTANLDGRDGAYNPQVNTRNNNLYGADTVPPARFLPGDIAATSHDRTANSITLTTTRMPG